MRVNIGINSKGAPYIQRGESGSITIYEDQFLNVCAVVKRCRTREEAFNAIHDHRKGHDPYHGIVRIPYQQTKHTQIATNNNNIQ